SGVPVAAAAQLLLPVAVPSTVVKPTVTDWVVAPVLVTVGMEQVVTPVPQSAWLTSSIASVGAVSSFTIVPVPVSFVMVALVAPLSLTVKASLSSKVVSAQTWTVMVLLGSRGAIFPYTTLFRSSGVPVAAAAQLLLPVAVPSTVVKPTVTDWAVAPVLVTVKVKAVVPPVLPSAWLTSSIRSEERRVGKECVSVPVSFVMDAQVASLSLTVKASLSS